MSNTLNVMQTEVYLNTSPDVNKSSLWLKPINGKTSPLFPESTVWVNVPTKSALVKMAKYLRSIFGSKVATLVIDLTAIQATSSGSMNIKFADFAGDDRSEPSFAGLECFEDFIAIRRDPFGGFRGSQGADIGC